MEFTREPVIETVITPKEGCKLVVRSSKNAAQEEYFVDAVEVVSFGHALFFRSLEKPKAFLVPTSDYEVLEVREARMVLKNVGLDRSIKIAGGRDGAMRGSKEITKEPIEKERAEPVEASQAQATAENAQNVSTPEAKTERFDRKRDRRRGSRKRRGAAPTEAGASEPLTADHPQLDKPVESGTEEDRAKTESANLTSVLTSLLTPPPNLISDTISRYKKDDLFRGAFFRTDEESAEGEGSSEEPASERESSAASIAGGDVSCGAPFQEETPSSVVLEQPAYGSFEATVEEEEAIYQERLKRQQESAHHGSGEDEEPFKE